MNRELQVLRRLFNLAKQWKKTNRPLAQVVMLKGEHQRERVVSKIEEEKYLKACPPLIKDVATIIFDCGLRPEELYRLNTENVQEDFLVIYYGKGKGSRRRIPMSGRVQEIIDRRLKVGGPWIFPAEKNPKQHINQSSIKKQHTRAIKESGVAFFVPYSLRHTCITRWSKKVDAYTLHYLAGHTDWKTTSRYVHPDEDRLRQILK